MRAASAAARNAAAYRSARSVIGLYGDQGVSWSILLEADVNSAPDPQLAGKRIADLVADHAHLGAAPTLVQVAGANWAAARSAFADRAYTPDEPLLRIALESSGSAARVLIAAHHGAADGIGLLAVLGAVLDEPVVSAARGVAGAGGAAARPEPPPFVLSAARRLGEALFAPPHRVAADRNHPAADPLQAATLPAGDGGKRDTAALVAAGARAVREFNAAHGAPARRVVAAVGASKSGGGSPNPWHHSTFLRLRVDPGATADDVRARLRQQPAEPDFPASRSPLAARAARLLAPRLGSTFLASNLGLISAGSVTAVRFYPAASGPNGVSFGMASTAAADTPETTTLTVRARGAAFSPAAAEDLLARLVNANR